MSCATPVIAFGDPSTARAATVGLNPSCYEFVKSIKGLPGNVKFVELDESSWKLKSLSALGVQSLEKAPAKKLLEVYTSCRDYFRLRPNHEWFDKLEVVLKKCGASYYDDSACHLDLVQLPTVKRWGEVPSTVQKALLDQDVEFLMQQLRNESVQLVLLNGREVLKTFQQRTGMTMSDRSDGATPSHQVYVGSTSDGVLVIGWSPALAARGFIPQAA